MKLGDVTTEALCAFAQTEWSYGKTFLYLDHTESFLL